MTHIASPLAADATGRTALANPADHLAAMLTRLLLTAPGQRVMRPDWGSGLGQMVWAPAGDEMAAATRYLVEGAIQQWLGDRLRLIGLATSFADGVLLVTVDYALPDGGGQRQLTVEVPA